VRTIIFILTIYLGFAYSQDFQTRKANGASTVLITGLFINELMSFNNTVIADANGQFDDWVEIYNSNTYAVDIGGLYVSDRSSTPEKYQIPSNTPAETTIPAGSFLIYWADAEPQQGSLHTNFILSHLGEFSSIVQNISGTDVYIDSISFPAIDPDVSYGRSADGGTPWRYFNPSSPGQSNPTDQPLPVELTSFAATVGNGQISLKWSTASELNVLGFVIQRSIEKDGTYQEIESYKNNDNLRGSGNSSQMRDYQVIDENVQEGQTFWYKLIELDIDGSQSEFGPIAASLSSGAFDGRIEARVPNTPYLQNFPNPFNPSTMITLDISSFQSSMVPARLTIYNTLGQQVRSLFAGELPPVLRRFNWDGLDDQGNPAPSGVYIYSFETLNQKISKRMQLIR